MELNWTSVFMGIGSTMFGIILYQSRGMQAAINADLKENHKQIMAVHQEVEAVKSTMPMQYVLRDYFLRSISNLDTKVDRMSNELTEIKKNIGKLAVVETKK